MKMHLQGPPPMATMLRGRSAYIYFTETITFAGGHFAAANDTIGNDAGT